MVDRCPLGSPTEYPEEPYIDRCRDEQTAMIRGPHRLRPLFWGVLYLALIPIFALIYFSLPGHFYQTTAHAEIASRRLFDRAETGLRDVSQRWVAALERHGLHQIVGLNVSGLTASDQNVGYVTPFLWPGPIPRRFQPKWVLEWPSVKRDQDEVTFVIEIQGLPWFVTDALAATPSAPHRQWDRCWGSVCGQVTREATPGSNDGVFNGFVRLSPKVADAIEQYRAARFGSAAYLEGGLLRSLYLSVVTITTLGLGDIVPVTDLARLIVALESILGVAIAGLFLNNLFASNREPQPVARPIVPEHNPLESGLRNGDDGLLTPA